jgi:hypothetical protein
MLGRFSHAKGMLASVAMVKFTKANELFAEEKPR